MSGARIFSDISYLVAEFTAQGGKGNTARPFFTGKKKKEKLVDGSLAVDETCPLALVNERKRERHLPLYIHSGCIT